jgi:hypothetical protein
LEYINKGDAVGLHHPPIHPIFIIFLAEEAFSLPGAEVAPWPAVVGWPEAEASSRIEEEASVKVEQDRAFQIVHLP